MLDTIRMMNPNRRFLVLAIIVGLVAMAVVVGRRATAPTYVTLFRELDLAEAGNITDALTKATIPFRLSSGGAEIDVPEADAARARVLLAQNGLPANGRPGLELFDKPSWGMTDFTQHVTYRRALEGELARTIGTLKGVQRAQVHLALPEASPLRRQEKSAEAAVVVSLRPNQSLDASQVRGISQLVSSSVEGMTPDHVSVIDDTGRPLSSNNADETDVGLSSHQLELQQSVEKHFASKVEQLLSTAVGAAEVRVQVAARLNFDQVDRTVEEYDPKGQVLTHEARSSGGDSATSQTVINNDFANSKRVEKIVSQVGNVTRLTVSAMVNSRALGTEGAVQDAQRAQLERLIRDAVGADSARGDRISVVAVAFSEPPTVIAAKGDTPTIPNKSVELVSKLGTPLAALLAVIAAFVLAWRALSSGRRALAALPRGQQQNELEAIPAPSKAVVPTPENIQLRNRVQAESLSQPEAAARVIRAWLADAA
ncbi:MAG: flagellar basal-body MS-ring/collar protein FliF [Gemmatimonadota bacterium]